MASSVAVDPPKDAFGKPRVGKPPARIVIGIDFGTTSSKMCFAVSTDPEQLHMVNGYPTSTVGAGTFSATIPTSIAYNEVGQVGQWGVMDSKLDILKLFKLLLLQDSPTYKEVKQWAPAQEVQELMNRFNKTPPQLAADYLRELWAFAIQDITAKLGTGRVGDCSLAVVMTVPALQEGFGKTRLLSKMKEIAQEAGILDEVSTTIDFVSEAEAAAVAMILRFKMKGRAKVNDNFVVMDCGGGTTDTIAFTVSKVKPLSLLRLTKARSDLCGARLLDDEFKKAIISTIQVDAWGKIPKELRRQIEAWWDHAKSTRDQDWGDNITLTFPCGNRVYKSSINLPQIFRSVVDRMMTLIMHQIDQIWKAKQRYPTYILLSGGLSMSPYLVQALTQALKDEGDLEGPGIEFIMPTSTTEALWAVAQGAVLRGLFIAGFTSELDVKIARVSNQSIGYMVKNANCRPRRAADKTEGDPFEIISKGQNIVSKENKDKVVLIDVENNTTLVHHQLYLLSEQPAPPVLHRIPTTLSLDQLRKFPREPGQTYRKVAFKYEVKWREDGFEFRIRLFAGEDEPLLNQQAVDVEWDEEASAAKSDEDAKRKVKARQAKLKDRLDDQHEDEDEDDDWLMD